MTVKDRVRDYLRTIGAGESFSPIEIARTLRENKNTVRRVLGELRNENTLVQPERGQYLYFPETAYVYKFVGYQDGTKWNMTFTSDHQLSTREQFDLMIEQGSEFGNISLIAEGESTDFDDAMIDGWDFEDTGAES